LTDGGGGAELAEDVDAVRLLCTDPASRSVVELRRCNGGQENLKITGGEQLLGIRLTCCDGSKEIPVRARAEVGDDGRGDIPGTQAELLRRLLVAEVTWACVTTAAQRLCSGEARRRRGR